MTSHRAIVSFVLILLMPGVLALADSSEAHLIPPLTRVSDFTDTYFGIKVSDPYRWLENLENPEVQTWFEAQADYASAILDHLPDRPALVAAISKYVNSRPAIVQSLTRCMNDRFFLEKLLPNANTGKLYMRDGTEGEDKLLVDTDEYAGPHGEAAAINYFTPSRDGRYVAVGISIGGSENATLHVFDAQTGKPLEDTIDRAEFGNVSWLPGDQSFCYCRLQLLKPGESELDKYLNSAIYLHQLGTSPDNDVLILCKGSSAAVVMTDVDQPAVMIEPDSQYAIASIEHGVQNDQTIYVAHLASIQNRNAQHQIPWTKLCDVEDQVTDAELHGSALYLLSHKDAPYFKVLEMDLQHPDIDKSSIVVPESTSVIRDLQVAGDALYVVQKRAGISHILRVGYDGPAAADVPLPFDGDASIYSSDQRIPGVMIGLTSWTRADQIYRYDPANNQVVPTAIQPEGPFDAREDISSTEVAVPSYDGAIVPLSIVFRKDIKLDGTNPTFIVAYGAYGISEDSGFSPSSLAWLDRGGVYAFAHVRGGGENGQDWYKAGFKVSKPNTWRDLIACSQYMIDSHYTSAAHLGITGGSAGGITMGRAITERPDLFAAADIRAGAVNTLRAELSPNGAPNIPEFGSVATQEGFEDLYAMDAYQHVRKGVAYPGVILTVGMNDPRVIPWEGAKLAARLQTATTSGRPILLRVDFKGGHGIGASKSQRIDQTADMYAFFLDQFQSTPTTRPTQ